MFCTDKIDLVAAFYAAVGIELRRERHGNGPEHFSFQSDLCLELYPPRAPTQAPFIIRIDVADLEETIRTLTEQFYYPNLVVKEIEALSSGKKSIVKDPDGRVVELFQPHP